MIPTSKSKYPSEAGSEGCGLCSFQKRCESREGRVLLSWRQSRRATKYSRVFGVCRLETLLVYWPPASYRTWLMQLNRLRLDLPCMQSYSAECFISPHYNISVERWAAVLGSFAIQVEILTPYCRVGYDGTASRGPQLTTSAKCNTQFCQSTFPAWGQSCL